VVLPLAEAIERLGSPFAIEAFSAVAGDPVLAVDFSGAELTDDDDLAAAYATLPQLACPSIAVGAGPLSAAGQRLRDRFDVVVASEAELELLLATVRRTPQAALAAVQLLRHNEHLNIHEGLIAESLMYSTLQAGPEFATWLGNQPPPRSQKPNPEPAVLVRRAGGRLYLTLNRPEKRNAFSVAMRDGLVEGLRVAIHDPSIAEVVLAGEGPAFCSGGDLDEFGSFPDPVTAHTIRSTRNPARSLAACGSRLSAKVHGACVGAGIELAAFAQHITAAETTTFQLPEVAMGLVPGAGGTASLPRRIGRQRTAYLALSGRAIDAATAADWGLVDALEEANGPGR